MSYESDLKGLLKCSKRLKTIRDTMPTYFSDRFDVVIAGGAIRDLFFGLDLKDVDFFLIPKNTPLSFVDPDNDQEKEFFEALDSWEVGLEQEGKMIRNCLHAEYSDVTFDYLDSAGPFDIDLGFEANPSKAFCKLTDKELNRWVKSQRSFHTTVKFFDAIPKNDEDDEPPYQVLWNPNYNSLEEVVGAFDLNICMFAFDGEGLYIHPEANIEEIEEAILNGGPVTLMNPYSSKARLKRFKEKYDCDIEQALKNLKDKRNENFPTTFVGVAEDNY